MLIAPHARADEGMWLLPLIEKNIRDMRAKGLRIGARDIYNPNGNSLTDAIVIFGNGCTGEIISPDGLLLTNHHCGYGNIQALSSVEHDYLKHGFWAMNRAEELHAPGLTVSFVRHMEEVTDRILRGVTHDIDEEERLKIIEQNTENYLKEIEGRFPGMNVRVRDMFGGNQFFVFAIEQFRDIRLVGTPPSSIGKFGGETDNWMWPRHTGDFAIFRVYTDVNGMPADYSPDNVPYKAPVHLKISLGGFKEGDFAMVLGFPGRTDRYMTTYEIDQMLESQNPNRIAIREARQQVLRRYMEASDAIRIQYSNKYANSSNFWKNSIGMSRGIQRLNVRGQKQEIQDRFTTWAEAKPERERFRRALPLIREAVEGRTAPQATAQIVSETMLIGTEILTAASLGNAIMQQNILGQPNGKERLFETAANFYKDYDEGVDRSVAVVMLGILLDRIPDALPAALQEVLDAADGDVEALVAHIYDNSHFANEERLRAYVEEGNFSEMQNDPAMQLRRHIVAIRDAANNEVREYGRMFREGHRLLIAGLMEMEPQRLHYSDANFTMRLTYGSILPYSPADAVMFDYFTTLTGVMEKEDPSNPMEFEVPERLKELYAARDFGRYGSRGNLPANFISNNDITGGNSGSPVLNGRGELIGLAFDGNWEAMSGDVAFETELQRCINVDIRYVLFIVDKFAGAGYLLDEMTIVR